MTRRSFAAMRARSAVIGSALVLALAAAFFLGDKHAVESMSIQQVNADQLGNAMRGDHFYSDYRQRTLVLHGTVAAVRSPGSGEQLTFTTTSPFSTTCQLTGGASPVTAGTQITVLAEGARAQRQAHGVLLVGCVLEPNGP